MSRMLADDFSQAVLKKDKRLLAVDEAMKQYGYKEGSLIEILHVAQEYYGWIDRNLLLYISKSLKLPASHVFGVATFYHFLRLKKPGSHTVAFCLGSTCYARGVQEIISGVEKEFNLKPGETTADGKLSLYHVRCVGASAMAPVVVIDDKIFGRETKESVLSKIKNLLESESN